MIIEFVGQSVQDGDNRSAATGRLVNLYRAPSEGKMVLKSVLGQELLADFSTVWMRDIERIGDDFYLSTGGSLRKLSEDGTKTTLGTVSDSADTTISGNNGDIAVAAGGSYYLWNGTTLSQPAAGQFSSFGSCCFIGGYTVLTEKDGRQFCWSDLLDASTLPALNYASAEAKDDKIIRGAAISGFLWLFKERSTEVWYVTGQSGANAFLRAKVLDTGLKDFGLLADYDGRTFMVGHDNVVYQVEGSDLLPVSATHAGVTYSIVNETPRNSFYFEDENHKFLAITFQGRPAWVYDLLTKEWHERAEGREDAWRAVNAVKGASDWFCGTDDGKVMKMARNNTDYGKELIRRAISRTLYQERPFSVDLVEFFGRVGWSDLGRDAQCWFRVSKDGANTWGAEKWLSLGDQGDYRTKLRRRAIGYCEDRFTVELNMSDPSEVSFDAQARLELS